MSTTTAGAPMTKRNDVSAKIDAEAVRIARNVATFRGLSLAEYLSAIVTEHAAADWREILEKEQQALPPKARGKK